MDLLLHLFSAKVAYADFDTFLANVNAEIIQPLIGLLFALAVVYFLFGVFKFMNNQASGEEKTSGKSHMLWGIIGITIMMSVWGILNLVIDTFDIEGVDPERGGVDLPDYTPPAKNNLNQTN